MLYRHTKILLLLGTAPAPCAVWWRHNTLGKRSLLPAAQPQQPTPQSCAADDGTAEQSIPYVCACVTSECWVGGAVHARGYSSGVAAQPHHVSPQPKTHTRLTGLVAHTCTYG